MKPLYDRYRCVRRMVRLASTSAVRLNGGSSSTSTPQPPSNSAEAAPSTLPTSEVFQTAAVAADSAPVATLEPSPLPEALLVTSSTNFSHTDTDRTASLRSNAPEASSSSTSSSSFLNWELNLLGFTQSVKNLDSRELTRGRAEILSVKHKLQRLLHDYEKRIQESTSNTHTISNLLISRSSTLETGSRSTKR